MASMPMHIIAISNFNICTPHFVRMKRENCKQMKGGGGCLSPWKYISSIFHIDREGSTQTVNIEF